MKKKFIEPEIVKIALNMTENIATSPEEEYTDVGGLKMRWLSGGDTKCREVYVKTEYSVMNEFNVTEIFIKGCIATGTSAEAAALKLMRR